ncbi:hypothetical protein ACFL1H_00745 [Nanoarchaeota archaeon]
MRNITKIMTGIVLGGVFTVPTVVEANTLNGIVKETVMDKVLRHETVLNLPLKTTLYTCLEKGNSNLVVNRLDKEIYNGKRLKVTGAVKYTNSAGPSHIEGGITTTIKDIKTTLRYFPPEDRMELFTFWKEDNWYFDILGIRNVETDSTMLRFGVGLNITDKWAVRIEQKNLGINELDQVYTVIGLQYIGKVDL